MLMFSLSQIVRRDPANCSRIPIGVRYRLSDDEFVVVVKTLYSRGAGFPWGAPIKGVERREIGQKLLIGRT